MFIVCRHPCAKERTYSVTAWMCGREVDTLSVREVEFTKETIPPTLARFFPHLFGSSSGVAPSEPPEYLEMSDLSPHVIVLDPCPLTPPGQLPVGRISFSTPHPLPLKVPPATRRHIGWQPE